MADMHIYLQPQEDSLPTRPVRAWTKDKLHYLAGYLEQFVVAMRPQNWRALHYIDLFAGPGKGQVQESGEIVLGSPLMAITQQRRFDRYFFTDLDLASMDALEKRYSVCPQNAAVHIFRGDANIQVRQIQQDIMRIDRYIPGVWSSLNLAFLDPEGLELHWKTVETLAKIDRMDMIIYYSQMGISREISKEIDESPPTRLDEFFGGTEWREIYKRHQKRAERFLHRQLIDLYKSKLATLGYQIVEGGPEPVMKNTKNAPLYRLLFMSKHELGYKFWKNAVSKDSSGQMRMF